MLDKAGHHERWGIVKEGEKGWRKKKHYIVYYGLILLKETNKPVYIWRRRLKKSLILTLTTSLSDIYNYKAPKAEIPTTMAAMTSTSKLYFDPDLHPDDTLRAFDEFIQSFELRYDAQYPDPPKTSLDGAIERWKLANTTIKSQRLMTMTTFATNGDQKIA
jgi:hypothetical protein